MKIILRDYPRTLDRWPTNLVWEDGLFYAEIMAPKCSGQHNIGHTTLPEAREVSNSLPSHPTQSLLNTIDSRMMELDAWRVA